MRGCCLLFLLCFGFPVIVVSYDLVSVWFDLVLVCLRLVCLLLVIGYLLLGCFKVYLCILIADYGHACLFGVVGCVLFVSCCRGAVCLRLVWVFTSCVCCDLIC